MRDNSNSASTTIEIIALNRTEKSHVKQNTIEKVGPTGVNRETLCHIAVSQKGYANQMAKSAEVDLA